MSAGDHLLISLKMLSCLLFNCITCFSKDLTHDDCLWNITGLDALFVRFFLIQLAPAIDDLIQSSGRFCISVNVEVVFAVVDAFCSVLPSIFLNEKSACAYTACADSAISVTSAPAPEPPPPPNSFDFLILFNGTTLPLGSVKESVFIFFNFAMSPESNFKVAGSAFKTAFVPLVNSKGSG